MGQLIILKPEAIHPSQDFLKKGTIEFIFDCYKREDVDALPPAPIVRRHPNKPDSFIAIDGHNLLAVHTFHKTACEVYLVDAADDYLSNPDAKESIAQRNEDLRHKYEKSVEEAERVSVSFAALVQKFIA